MSLTAAEILAAADQKIEELNVPEWGGSVFVKVMRSVDRDRYEKEVQGGIPENIRAKLAVKTLCNENGDLLFQEKDIEALGAKSASALDRVVEKAMEINRYTDKDIEALEGN